MSRGGELVIWASSPVSYTWRRLAGGHSHESDTSFFSCSYHFGQAGRHRRDCCCSWRNWSQNYASLEYQMSPGMSGNRPILLSLQSYVRIWHTSMSDALLLLTGRQGTCTQAVQFQGDFLQPGSSLEKTHASAHHRYGVAELKNKTCCLYKWVEAAHSRILFSDTPSPTEPFICC